MQWRIEEKGFNQEKIEFFGSKFSVGNGYFGYRGTLQEYGKEQLAACTLSEIFDDNGNGWREPINMPNGLLTKVYYQNKPLSVLDSKILEHTQGLDLSAGKQYRQTILETEDGKKVTIEANQFASIDNIHLLVMEYSVKAESAMELTIQTGIDEEIWNINGNHFASIEQKAEGAISGLVCKTLQDSKEIAIGQLVKITKGNGTVTNNDTDITFALSLQPGETFAFEKYVAIGKDTDCEKPWESVMAFCSEASDTGFETLLSKQSAAWKKRYDSFGLSIEGDEEALQAIYYSYYLLYSSAPTHTDTVAIPARGLSGQVYKGAYFWDTEIYMLPMFAYCAPEIAKNLMMYRVHNLEGAYEKAQEYGYRGAFFPWESQEKGQDGCTHYNLTDIFTGRKMRTYFRDKQVHISADVAYGIWKYVTITKDKSILLEGGAEVIMECARFFNSYAYFKKDKDRFELLDVTGADEYHERVNNDAYTNYMVWLTAKITLEVLDFLAKEHPDYYQKVLEKLDYEKELPEVKEMAEKIYLPRPNQDGIIEQFSGYFKEEDLSIEELYSRIIEPNEYLGSPVGLAVNTQIIKQADVILLLSLLSEEFSEDVKEKNWAYYEPRTEHGSSLSTCIYALLAAKIGKVDWAYQFLMKAAKLDLLGNYKQYLGPLYIGGTHPAANGGTWMVAVQGFGGLEAVEDGIVLNPHLPGHWKQLSFRFVYGEYTCQACMDSKGISLHVEADTEAPLKVKVRDKIFTASLGDNYFALW